MSKFLSYGFLLVGVILFSCKSENKKQNTISTNIINNPITASGEYSTEGLPKIEFDKEKHDFGLIVEGEKVSYIFKYKNTGKSDLIIKSASATCGCTVPTFSQEPIGPGKEGSIEVVFNSSGRSGKQHKTITVLTNCQPNIYKLQIEGEIIQ